MKNGKLLVLAAQIQADLADLERVVSRAELIFEKAIRTDDDAYLDGLALNLHGFYAGAEHIFEAVARALDGELPDDPHWHQTLLRQMMVEISTVRPAVISRSSYEFLEGYRSFRHVVRNVYTFNLRGTRLKELATGLRPCLTALVSDLERFVAVLHQLGEGGE